MKERMQVNLNEYTAATIRTKLSEANEQRKELGRKPLRVCDFMEESVDRVTVAQLVRL